MKNTKLNIFKHKLQWLVLLVALLGICQLGWASGEYGRKFIYLNFSNFSTYITTGGCHPCADFHYNNSCNDKEGSTDSFTDMGGYYYYFNLKDHNYSYIRGFNIFRSNGGDWWSPICVGTDGNKNCIKVTDWGAASFETYVQTPTYSSLTLSGYLCGDGTSSNPYLVIAGSALTFSSSASLPYSSDTDMSIRYYHGTSSSGSATSSTSSYNTNASATIDQTTHYYGRVRGYYSPGTTYGSYVSNKEIYVKTIKLWVAGTGGYGNSDWDRYEMSTSDGITFSKALGNTNTSCFKFLTGSEWGAKNEALYNLSGWTEDESAKVGANIGVKQTCENSGSQITFNSGYGLPATLYINISTKKMWVVATASCTDPDEQEVTTNKSSICVSSSETATISCSAQSGYYYQLAIQNGASWDDVGDPETESSGSVSFIASVAGTYKVYAYSGAHLCETDMSNTVTITDKTPTITPSTNIKAYMPVTVTGNASSVWSISTNPSGNGWLSASSGATTVFKAPYNASNYVVTDTNANCSKSITVGQDSETCP